jgi:hypothetical protein
MTNLLILLPIASFLCLFIWLTNRSPSAGTRLTFIRSFTLTAVYAILSLEILSPVRFVTQPALIAVWGLPLVAFCIWVGRIRHAGGKINLPVIKGPNGWGEWLAFSGVALIILVTALIAWVSPPMTWDSMSYHMSRIAHWAENQSVWHYITGIERQNSMSPGAEMLTLHGYILTGTDRFAQFTEWLAMLGSVIGVSLIVKFMGGRRHAQWLAALFAVSLPMGITQASSTITDYVVAFWLVCLAVNVLHYQMTEEKAAIFYAILASGMAVLTKPTCVPYLVPLIIWMVVLVFKRLKPVAILKWALAAAGLMALICGGYITRNLVTFGGLSNPQDFTNHINQLRTPAGFFSNVLKNAALHAGTPNDYLNNELDIIIRKVHIKIGVDIMDPRTTGDGYFKIREPAYSEDLVSNPYHAMVALLSFIMALFLVRRLGWKTLLYACCVAAGFIMYCGFYKWHLFNVRYHLSFFILIAPVFGLVAGYSKKIHWGAVLAAVLWITSIPYLVSLSSRPLIPMAEFSTNPSIITQTREELRFANCRDCYQIYKTLVGEIENNGCSQVGVMLSGDAGEYLFWKLFDAPLKELRIEWIVAGTPSERYKPMDFQPCAVICDGCGADQAEIRGLNLFSIVNDYALYMNPGNY